MHRLILRLISKIRLPQFSFSDFIKNMLDKKAWVLLIVLIIFFASLGILLNTERQFLPRVDQRQFIIKVDLPPGARLEVTDSVIKKIERLLLGLAETKDVTINIGSGEEKASAEESAVQTLGSHQAQIMVNLKKKSRRLGVVGSTDEVIHYLKTRLEKQSLEGAQIEYIAQETSLGAALEQGAPIAIEIKGPDLNRLQEISSSLQLRLKKIAGIYGIKSSMPSPSPETKLHIFKDKASLYGMSVRDIAVTTQVALKGYVATKFKEKAGQEDVDIRVRLRPEDRSDFGNLRRLLVHSPLGMNIPLSEVAYLTKGRGPTEIKRIDQQRNIIVTANIFKRNFNRVIADIDKIIASLSGRPSKDYSIVLGGEQQRMKESFNSLAFALIFAIILVYMIMAAEFESLWQPFLIIFTVPLALIGVVFALIITRTPLSVVAYLGIIMLGGIAVNNGIVLIDFINNLRKKGYSAYEAVVQASKTRLRPILMTSLTTILGLLPLALGFGEGAELRAPLAITVMGGLTSATFLTLVFIPALYLTVAERIKPKPVLVEEIKVPPGEIGPKAEIEDKVKAEVKVEEKIEIKPEEEEKIKPEVEAKEEVKPEVEKKIEPEEEIKPKAEIKPEEEIKPLVPEVVKEVKPEAPAEKELNARQKETLEKLKVLKKITRKEYADMFAISAATAARDLKELLNRKLLRAQGPLGPGRWYEPY